MCVSSCERSFSISSNLQRHVRNIHNKDRQQLQPQQPSPRSCFSCPQLESLHPQHALNQRHHHYQQQADLSPNPYASRHLSVGGGLGSLGQPCRSQQLRDLDLARAPIDSRSRGSSVAGSEADGEEEEEGGEMTSDGERHLASKPTASLPSPHHLSPRHRYRFLTSRSLHKLQQQQQNNSSRDSSFTEVAVTNSNNSSQAKVSDNNNSSLATDDNADLTSVVKSEPDN